MEFADVGSHCSEAECKQQDFLPFTCSKCSRTFCLQHRSVLAHECARADEGNKKVPECPLCNRMADTSNTIDVNEAVERHIASGCKVLLKAASLNTAHKCSISRCRTKDIIEMKCKHCNEHFCVAHRMPSDHACVPKGVGSVWTTPRRQQIQVRA